MAIIPGQQKNGFSFASLEQEKQKKMIYIFAAVLVAMLIVVYFGFFRDSTPTPSQINNGSTAAQDNANLEGLKNANLNPAILQDKKFQSLVLPGEFPILVGEKGRENPFAPF